MRLNAPSLTYLVSSLPHASVSLRSFAPTEDNEGESRPVSLRFLLDPRLHSRPPNLQKSLYLHRFEPWSPPPPRIRGADTRPGAERPRLSPRGDG